MFLLGVGTKKHREHDRMTRAIFVQSPITSQKYDLSIISNACIVQLQALHRRVTKIYLGDMSQNGINVPRKRAAIENTSQFPGTPIQ
jgi:hypothetical protein